MRFAYANASFDEAEAVLFGAPDEAGSHAPRSGSKHGPEAIRRASRIHLRFPSRSWELGVV